MKTLRNTLTTIILTIVLTASTSFAKTGLLVSDLANGGNQPCVENKEDSNAADWGIIVQGLSGIIVQGFTGIIVQGAIDTNTECGVIVHD